MPDPDLEVRGEEGVGGGGHSDPVIRGGGGGRRCPKRFFGPSGLS